MKNKALNILFLSNGFFVLAQNMIGPLYAIYAQKFAVSILTISFSWAAYLISTTVCTYIVMQIGDRFRKDYFLAMGFLLRALVWLGFIFVENIYQLMLLQILLGVGEALGTSSFQAMVAEHLDKNEHVKDYAYWQLVANIVMVIGTVGGGIIVGKYGFNTLFLSMYALAMISFFILIARPKKINIE